MQSWLLLTTPFLLLPVVLLLASVGCAADSDATGGIGEAPEGWESPSVEITYLVAASAAGVRGIHVECWASWPSEIMGASSSESPHSQGELNKPLLTTGKLDKFFAQTLDGSRPFSYGRSVHCRCALVLTDGSLVPCNPSEGKYLMTKYPPTFHVSAAPGEFRLTWPT